MKYTPIPTPAAPKAKFGSEIPVLEPPSLGSEGQSIWVDAMNDAESHYMSLVDMGVSPEIARSVLPNSLKADIAITANMREWMHIFSLRLSRAAHPQIRQVMEIGYEKALKLLPCIFDGIF